MLRRFPLSRRLAAIAVPIALLGAGACVHRFTSLQVRAVQTPAAGTQDTIRSTVKAHLLDGSTVIFRRGAVVTRERIMGDGESWSLLAGLPVPRGDIPMDSVLAVESFANRWLVAQSIVASVAATAATAAGAAVLAVAIFGSCPTIYADSAGTAVLQAEGFSYAIAPMMEHRDLDPLRVRSAADGRIRLELRNEALETHFINHVELVGVRHARGARVVPDQSGRPVVLHDFVPVSRATDRAGRDVRALLESADGAVFATAPAVIRGAREGDLDDWIELDVAGLPPGDSIAVVLRARNSLLNTILLYEGMLGGRDAPDWLARDMQHVGRTVELARWYVRTMGMRATVNGIALPPERSFEAHARVGDVGPIAFRDVAFVLPRPPAGDGRARVRLSFVADNWRIDEVRVAARLARPAMVTLPVDSVIVPVPAHGDGPQADTAAVRALSDPDGSYFETRPGQRMTLVFRADTSAVPADSVTTWSIAWQGWYNEWIRGRWLAQPTRTTPFVPGDQAVLTALRRWSARQAEFEREFHASKIPVR